MKKLLLIIFFSIIGYSYSQDTTSVSGELEVHYLNVGQADAVFIICPTKEHTMLIDAGDTRYPGSSKDFKTGIQELLDTGSKIDLVVASHPHADHIGNMKWVFENYIVLRYLDNGELYESATYNNLMEVVYEQSDTGVLEYETAVHSRNSFVDFCPANNVNAEIIMTDDLFSDCRNPNNCSVILKVQYNKISFLFAGDAEKEQEEKLLKDITSKRKLRADVLKAGHHGSNTSSSYAFVKAIAPRYIVVSVGEKNRGTNTRYKHPQSESVTNFNLILKTKTYRDSEVEVYDKATKKWILKKVKSRVLFTHIDGKVVIASDGFKIRLK